MRPNHCGEPRLLHIHLLRGGEGWQGGTLARLGPQAEHLQRARERAQHLDVLRRLLVGLVEPLRLRSPRLLDGEMLP